MAKITNFMGEMFSEFFNNSSVENNRKRTISMDDFLEESGGVSSSRNAMGDATYFTCVRMLSEGMGKLSVHLYQDTDDIGVQRKNDLDVIHVIKTRPNPYMTPSVFWSTIEANRVHHGNAYVYVRYDGLAVKDLWIMQSTDVTVLIDDRGIFGQEEAIWYQYNDPQTGKLHTFHSDNVLHFKTSTTFDGIIGESFRSRLGSMIDGNLESQGFMENFFKGGLSARAVLQYTGDLDEQTKKRLIDGISKFASGSNNAGKIIPIPLGMQLSPLNIKLTDAQFVELRKLNALQISAGLGIKPNHLNDYSKSSYSNSEMQNLSFYTDTLLYIVKQYEEEITYKLLTASQVRNGYYLKFNIQAILRADAKTQADTLNAYVNNGVMTPNEVRSILDLPHDENGNKLVMNGNYIPLSDVGVQYGVDNGD